MPEPTQSSKRLFTRPWKAAVFTAVVAATSPGQASVGFGTLSAIDVINDTGVPTQGFEIELRGIQASQINDISDGSTYGRPTFLRENIPDPSDPGKTIPVVTLRYQSRYDADRGAFVASTPPVVDATVDSNGRNCSRAATTEPADGCAHFGVGINGNPTAVSYRWLIADSARPGNLVPADSHVSLVAPNWLLARAATGPSPAVRSRLPLENPAVSEKRACSQFGLEAQWVKSDSLAISQATLDSLTIDCGGAANCQSRLAQASAEAARWHLLQARPTCDDFGQPLPDAQPDWLESAAVQLQASNRALVTRFEFYAYAGEYDPITHQAIPAEGCQGAPYRCGTDGEPNWASPTADLGGFRGAQNAAVNIDDADNDGQPNASDNCGLRVNRGIAGVVDQLDTDGDGYGNACDPDLNNDGSVDAADLERFGRDYGRNPPNPDADFSGDGRVGLVDLAVLKLFFGGSPGPRGRDLPPAW